MVRHRGLMRFLLIIAPVLMVGGLVAGLRQPESRQPTSAASIQTSQLPPAPAEESVGTCSPIPIAAEPTELQDSPRQVYELPDDDATTGPVLLASAAEGQAERAGESVAKTVAPLATTIEESPVRPAGNKKDAAASSSQPSTSTVARTEPSPRPKKDVVGSPTASITQPAKTLSQAAAEAVRSPEKPAASHDAPRPAADRVTPIVPKQPVSTPNGGQADKQPKKGGTPQPIAVRNFDDSWQEPTALIQNLRELDGSKITGRWAADVLRQLHALKSAMAGSSSREADAILRRLNALSQQATEQAANMPDRPLTAKLRRAAFAIARRVDIWQHLELLKTSPATADRHLDPVQLAKCLSDIESLIGNSADGRAWRRYMLVDSLRDCLSRHPGEDDIPTRQTAQRALVRLTQIPLSSDQQQFLTREAVIAYRDELRHWAAEPIDAAVLLRDIERYETTVQPSDSRRLAIDCGHMLESPVAARRQLAARVNTHYRNANFRVAVTEGLLNALIPERKVEYAQISDVVQNRPTRGQSVMASEVVVRMLPDPKRVRMALEVRGEIAANTTTDAGAARFFNESQSWYVARKRLEINMKGITLWPAEVEVHNDTQLQGVDTKLGNVPFIGFAMAQIAKNQYDQNKSAAAREVEQKIIRQASERVDTETKEQFAGVVAKLNQRVFDPLNNLALDPQLVDAETQEHRFTMRLRVGGEDQIGSHTPRPNAPADSLASVQLHESAMNNGLRRLQLEGRTFTIPELAQHVATSLNCAPWETTPDNEDVKITFARRDPVVVRCHDGQVILTFSMQRLSKSPHRWDNFQVRAFYRPEVHGRNADLVREGVIRLMGPRLSTGSQIALRGIFSHALSKKTPFQLMPKQIADDPKLKDAAVTQFVIEDGWIGLSLGPKPQVGPLATRQRAAE